MIGRITGVLIEMRPPQIVVECNGIGYEIEAPMTTIWALPELNHTVSLYTHLTVREDAHLLYGFVSESERALFRSLLKVNGVGTKMALVILSGMDADAFAECVHAGDTARLTALPGVGKKTAERLIIEMRDRVRHPGLGASNGAGGSGDGPVEPRAEALDALVALGYKPPEARRMLDKVPESVSTIEDLLRAVLRSAAGTRN